MKITSDNNMNPLSPLRNAKPSQSAKVGDVDKTDKVEFSSVLQEMRQTQGSETAGRSEKVQALKAEIANGSYNPDLKQVAISFLKSFFAG